MSKNPPTIPVYSDPLDCFGTYNKTNLLCVKHCVMRLRCAIEQDQNMRLELLEDLVAADGMMTKIQ